MLSACQIMKQSKSYLSLVKKSKKGSLRETAGENLPTSLWPFVQS